MPRLPARWSRWPLVALLLCACGPPPCPRPGANDEGDLDPLVAIVADPASSPARRVEAVQGLSCLARLERRPHPGLLLGILTVGLSEVIAEKMAEPVVHPSRMGRVVDALARAMCDPSPEVSAAAEGELQTLEAPIAGPVLERAVRSCAGPRAVAAVGVLEKRTLELLEAERAKGAGQDTKWSGLVTFGPAVRAAGESDKPEVRTRGSAAEAKIVAAIESVVLARARSTNPDVVSASAELREDVPFFRRAFERAAPAFRARLTDPDYQVRLAAARVVWLLEGSGDAALDRLTSDLWTGVRLPAPVVQPSAGTKLRALVKEVDAPLSPYFEQRDELIRLAHEGPAAAPALGTIRALLALPDDKLRSDLRKGAAAAIAFIAGDRATLPVLRQGYNEVFSNNPSAYGLNGEVVAQAILHLEPDDAKARAALGLTAGPLLAAVTRKAIHGERLEWWIALLLRQDKAVSPPPTP